MSNKFIFLDPPISDLKFSFEDEDIDPIKSETQNSHVVLGSPLLEYRVPGLPPYENGYVEFRSDNNPTGKPGVLILGRLKPKSAWGFRFDLVLLEKKSYQFNLQVLGFPLPPKLFTFQGPLVTSVISEVLESPSWTNYGVQLTQENPPTDAAVWRWTRTHLTGTVD